MDKQKELEIVNQFPELCRDYLGNPLETCFAWGFECENGWYNLIEDTFTKLENIRKECDSDFWIAQIKEKFGTLSIYLNFKKGNNPPELRVKIYKIIDEAEAQSATISEISGEPAKLRSMRGWLKTMTDEEFNTRTKQ